MADGALSPFLRRPVRRLTALFLITVVLVTMVLPGSFRVGTASATNSFPVDGSGSWNSRVPCSSPWIVRISDITNNMTGSGSYNSSIFSPGTPSKRWLTPGPTPPGWQSPGPSCTITDSQGQTVAAFVEIDGVGLGGYLYEEGDCRTNYSTVNGGSPLPPGNWCDSTGTAFDPAMVPNYSASCTSTTDPTCLGRIHVEFDGDWMATGYCGIGTASCDNNTIAQQTVPGSASTLIDIQGYVYWDPDHVDIAYHSYSGWELHPVTAWRPHNSVTQFGASFTYSPGTPTAGQSVTFTATASGGTPPYSYSWSFGDGTTGAGSSTSHAYAITGSYNVVLTAKDSSSPQQTATSQRAITITNQAPLSTSFTFSPSSPDAGQSVVFTASASGGVSPYSYSWSFGDGGTGAGNPVSHPYQSATTYTVSLTLTDSSGQVAKTSRTITVNPRPTASFTYTPSNPLPLQVVTFSATASGGTQQYGYSWNFGDGSAGTGASVSHSYLLPGSYTVTLTVTDSNGQTATASQTITVLISLV